jgi:hypothetical protein
MPTLPFASTINTVEVASAPVVGVLSAKRGMVELEEVAVTVRRAVGEVVAPRKKLFCAVKRAASTLLLGWKLMKPALKLGFTAVVPWRPRKFDADVPPRAV